MQRLRGQIGQRSGEFAKGASSAEGVRGRIDLHARYRAFDERVRAPVLAFFGCKEIASISRRHQMQHTPLDIGCALRMQFCADVARHSRDVLANCVRIGKHQRVDSLMNVAANDGPILIGRKVRIVDMAAAVPLRRDVVSLEREMRAQCPEHGAASFAKRPVSPLARFSGDRFRLQKEQQVVAAAGFTVRAGHIEAPERIAADQRAGALAIDIQVAGKELVLGALDLLLDRS